MSRPEGGLHGLKAYPSARSDDQDFRHGIMLLVGLAWLIVMCNAGSRTARRAGGLHMKGWRAHVPTMRREGATGCGDPTEGQVRLARDAYGAFVLALERMVSVSSCVRRSDRLRQLNFSTIEIFLIPRAIISIG